MRKLFETLRRRWSAPTPKLWRRVRRFGIFLGSSGAALLALPESAPKLLPLVGAYCVLAGALVGALAQLAEEDPTTPTEAA